MYFESSSLKNQDIPEVDLDDFKSFKDQYFSLLECEYEKSNVENTRSFLVKQLQKISVSDNKIPTDDMSLIKWLNDQAERVGQQYQYYLINRKNGHPRKYFSNKAHALHFIKTVAPTKMVDGAWLYGFLHHHKSARFHTLIKTYLEELGEGVQEKNHVALYLKLLLKYGLNHYNDLDDKYYEQGAIQLALGQLSEHFAPEVIGFNLGYEQLPLHLLITAYELKELGIDSYYFSLHITIDNASSGHARDAVHSVIDNAPLLADRNNYFARVFNGYQLNNLGAGTEEIIADFDLEEEFRSILKNKAIIGKYMHGNHCLLEGKSINEWLSNPEEISLLIDSLESNAWIRRNENPTQSRFWKLIDNEKAMMFGVFSAYEKQVIYDWIAGTYVEQPPKYNYKPPFITNNNHCKFDANEINETDAKKLAANISNICPMRKIQNIRTSPQNATMSLDDDMNLFQQQINRCDNSAELMQLLSHWMAPGKHHTAIGLKATELFTAQLKRTDN